MRILHTGDWHFDLSNLRHTTHAAAQIAEKMGEVDLVVNTGDLGVHRGAIHPHVAFETRRAIHAMDAQSAHGSIIVKGNHDDSYHAERVGSVRGIMDSGTGSDGRIVLAETPTITVLTDLHGINPVTVAIVSIPSPNKYMLAAADADIDPSAALATVIQSSIATARGLAEKVVVAYHGTVIGCKAGDELIMTAGMDIGVYRSAFIGADAVMLGHIHRKQTFEATDQLPPMIYPGSIAPLNWGERKLQPGFITWEITREGVTWTETLLPVLSQMLDIEIDIAADARDAAVVALLGAESGDRVRLRASGPASVIDALTPSWKAVTQERFGLESFKVIPLPTDAGIARMSLEDGWTLGDAFADYGALKAVPADRWDAHLEVFNEIERQVEDRHLDACYEFRPLRMRAENWCQYPRLDVDFEALGEVTAVTGPNFSGKSNLMRALLFGLYKMQVSGAVMADLVRIPEKTAWVEVEFGSGGHTYRIRRELKVQNDGGVAGQFYLWDTTTGENVSINEATVHKTQAALERMIGPRDLFLTTTFAGQGDVTRLLRLTPSEMKDVLVGVLQRNFEARQDIARAMARDLEREMDKAAAEAGTLEEMAGNVDELQIGLDTATEQMARIRGDIEAHGAGLELEAKVEGLIRNEASMAEKASRFGEAEAEITTTMNTELLPAQRRVDGCRRARDEAAAMDVGDGMGDGVVLVEAADRADAAAEETGGRRNAMAAERAIVGANLATVLSTARGDSTVAIAKAADLKSRILRAERAAQRLVDVPCGGKKWMRVVGKQDPPFDNADKNVGVDMAGCPLIADAAAARDEIPDLRERLGVAEQEVLDTVRAQGEASDALDAWTREGADLETLEHEAMQAAKLAKAARRLVSDHQQQAQQHEAQVRKAAELKVLGDQLPDAEQALTAVRLKITDLQGRRDEYASSVRQHDAVKHDLVRARGELAEHKLKADSMAVTLAAFDGQATTLKTKIEAAEATAVKVQAARTRGADAAARLEPVRFYGEAMHRDGLPFLLLEQFAIPSLRARMNDYLANSGFRVSVESEREKIGGELKNAVDIRFSDHRGTHHVSAASGAQETAISMALINALADLNAEATGSRIWLTVQDEGFGTMDPENISAAKATIKQIAARRGCFIFISHVPGMAEIADTTLAVTDSGGISTVEVA